MSQKTNKQHTHVQEKSINNSVLSRESQSWQEVKQTFPCMFCYNLFLVICGSHVCLTQM